MKIGDVVVNLTSGDEGTVDRVNLGPGLRDCVLVRFHDQAGQPQGDGFCIPRARLRVKGARPFDITAQVQE